MDILSDVRSLLGIIGAFIAVVTWLLALNYRSMASNRLSNKNKEDIEELKMELAVQKEQLLNISSGVDKTNDLLEKNNTLTQKLDSTMSGMRAEMKSVNGRLKRLETKV